MAKDKPGTGPVKKTASAGDPEPGTLARRRRAETFKRLVLDRSIAHGAVRLFMLLFTYCNEKAVCWPGQRELQRRLGCSNDSFKPWLASLRAGKYLTTRIQLTAKGKLTIYTLNFQCVFLEPGAPGVPASGTGVPGFAKGVPKSGNGINSMERNSKEPKESKTSW